MTLPITVRRIADAADRVLNRLVFVGVDCCEDTLDPYPVGTRPSMSEARALATVAAERLVPELEHAGLQRISRANTRTLFRNATATVALWIESSSFPGEAADAMAREYATLLTRTVAVSPTTAVRVAAPVAQVALWWREHVRSRLPLWDSPAAESVIELVARSACDRGAMQAAPRELATEIRRACAAIVGDPLAHLAVTRALVDARSTPRLADAALNKLRSVATTEFVSN